MATKWPSASNKAQLKSNRSLIFVLEAVLYSVIPIYSAIDIKRWAKILNSIASKVPCLVSFWISNRVISRFYDVFIQP